MPIAGSTLKSLKNKLHVKTSFMLWLFGWSSPQWSLNLKKGAGELPAQHSILIRLLRKRPDLCPIPDIPTGSEVFGLLREIDPELREREFPVLLGLEPGSKDRMLDDSATRTPIINHLLLIIKDEITTLKTQKEKQAFLNLLKSVVIDEAESRNMDTERFWRIGGWRSNMPDAD